MADHMGEAFRNMFDDTPEMRANLRDLYTQVNERSNILLNELAAEIKKNRLDFTEFMDSIDRHPGVLNSPCELEAHRRKLINDALRQWQQITLVRELLYSASQLLKL